MELPEGTQLVTEQLGSIYVMSRVMAIEMSLKEVLSRFKLTQEELDQPCTFEQCNDLASKMVKWEPVAPYIGLNEANIEAIKRDNTTYEYQRSASLNKWKDKYGSKATFFKLAQGFEKIKSFDHVEKVCEVFISQKVRNINF